MFMRMCNEIIFSFLNIYMLSMGDEQAFDSQLLRISVVPIKIKEHFFLIKIARWIANFY